MPKTKYRVVTDRYAGYEIQQKTWWWPWWRMPVINTHISVEKAESWLRHYLNRKNFKPVLVKNLD